MTLQELIDDLKFKGLDDLNTINFAINCFDAGRNSLMVEYNVLMDAHQSVLRAYKQLKKEKQHD
jgi:hypothetical protein